ncbi:hypothetical protein D3C79_1076190 [compost metagenome]
MPDTAIQLTYTLATQRFQIELRQRLAIGQLQADAGHGHAIELQHIVATAQGIEPLLGLGCRHGGRWRRVDFCSR